MMDYRLFFHFISMNTISDNQENEEKLLFTYTHTTVESKNKLREHSRV